MNYILELLLDILSISFPYALLSLGIFLSYQILKMADLTAEGSFTLGGVVTLTTIVLKCNPLVSTLLAIIFGFMAGVITGVLHTKLKIPSLLAGIITMTALVSINLVIMGLSVKNSASSNAVVLPNNLNTIFSYLKIFTGSISMLNQVLISLIVVLIICFFIYWFYGTKLGMAIRATGINPLMAKAQGINVETMIIIGLGVSNALIALGGSLFAQRNRSFEIGSGTGALIIGLAAVIIGEVILGNKTFKKRLIGVVLGSILYFLIVSLAIEIGLPTYLKNLLYAVMITIALTLPLIKKKIIKWKEKPTC